MVLKWGERRMMETMIIGIFLGLASMTLYKVLPYFIDYVFEVESE